MRTTRSIDDDVLEAARAIADRTRRSLGAVVSELAGLVPPERPDARPIVIEAS